MGADFNNDFHHCTFPWEEGSDFSGCSLSASQHALLQDPWVNRERKQKPVPKGTVPHTGDSASYSCHGIGETIASGLELRGWMAVEHIRLSLLCLDQV